MAAHCVGGDEENILYCCSIKIKSKQIFALLKPNNHFTGKIFVLPVKDLEGKTTLSTKYLFHQFLL